MSSTPATFRWVDATHIAVENGGCQGVVLKNDAVNSGIEVRHSTTSYDDLNMFEVSNGTDCALKLNYLLDLSTTPRTSEALFFGYSEGSTGLLSQIKSVNGNPVCSLSHDPTSSDTTNLSLYQSGDNTNALVNFNMTDSASEYMFRSYNFGSGSTITRAPLLSLKSDSLSNEILIGGLKQTGENYYGLKYTIGGGSAQAPTPNKTTLEIHHQNTTRNLFSLFSEHDEEGAGQFYMQLEGANGPIQTVGRYFERSGSSISVTDSLTLYDVSNKEVSKISHFTDFSSNVYNEFVLNTTVLNSSNKPIPALKCSAYSTANNSSNITFSISRADAQSEKKMMYLYSDGISGADKLHFELGNDGRTMFEISDADYISANSTCAMLLYNNTASSSRELRFIYGDGNNFSGICLARRRTATTSTIITEDFNNGFGAFVAKSFSSGSSIIRSSNGAGFNTLNITSENIDSTNGTGKLTMTLKGSFASSYQPSIISEPFKGVKLPFSLLETTSTIPENLNSYNTAAAAGTLPSLSYSYISAFDTAQLSPQWTSPEHSSSEIASRNSVLMRTVPSTYAVIEGLKNAVDVEIYPFSLVVDRDSDGNDRFGIRFNDPADATNTKTAWINFATVTGSPAIAQWDNIDGRRLPDPSVTTETWLTRSYEGSTVTALVVHGTSDYVTTGDPVFVTPLPNLAAGTHIKIVLEMYPQWGSTWNPDNFSGIGFRGQGHYEIGSIAKTSFTQTSYGKFVSTEPIEITGQRSGAHIAFGISEQMNINMDCHAKMTVYVV